MGLIPKGDHLGFAVIVVDAQGTNEIPAIVDVTSPVAKPTNDVEKDKAGHTRVVPSYTWRFWAIVATLCVTGLLVAVEGTVTSTALPSIIKDLQGGSLYVWVINGYFLTW